MVAGGHAWWQGVYGGRGYVVAGGHVSWQRGACMVVGGMHGGRGACVVAGGACVVEGVVCGGEGAFVGVGYDEIRSMSGQEASYWNAFL